MVFETFYLKCMCGWSFRVSSHSDIYYKALHGVRKIIHEPSVTASTGSELIISAMVFCRLSYAAPAIFQDWST